MDWKSIGNIVAQGAPILGTLLGGPAGAAVGGLIASALGSTATPDDVAAAIQADPDAMVKLRQLEMEHEAELRRMVIEAETRQQAEVNATMRAEAASSDPYVRRWRPFIGYVVGCEFALLGLAVIVVAAGATWAGLTGETTAVPVLFEGLATLVGAMTTVIAAQCVVLGVNVASRSKDKQVEAGQTPAPGLLGALAQRLAGARAG